MFSFLSLLVALLCLPVLGASLFFFALIVSSLYNITLGEYLFNPWSHIPAAPHKGSWLSTIFLGDFGAIKEADPGAWHARTISRLGNVFRYRHMFGKPRIFISDPKALLYIHGPQRAYKYPKPESTATFLRALLGNGLLVAEGDIHRRQRRILSPAFSNTAVKELQPVMEKHAFKLARKIEDVVDHFALRAEAAEKEGHTGVNNGAPLTLQDGEIDADVNVALHSHKHRSGKNAAVGVVDVLFWASRTSLDIIGEAGFGYHFKALEQGHSDELSQCFNETMSAIMDVDLVHAVTILLSEIRGLTWLRKLPTKRNKSMKKNQETIQNYSRMILDRAKRETVQELAVASAVGSAVPVVKRKSSNFLTVESAVPSLRRRGSNLSVFSSSSAGDEESDDAATLVGDSSRPPSPTIGRTLTKEAFDEALGSAGALSNKVGSLLHRVVRANMASDLRANEKLSDDELMQVPSTFLLAGSETTSTQLSWLLRLLGENLDVQEKLREEVLAARKEHGVDESTYEHDMEEEEGRETPLRFGDVQRLPYLDLCIKEALRLMPSIPSTVRVATEDDVVPLSKPYSRKDGKGTFDSVVVPKGHEMFVPIAAVGLSTELWGPDAHKYRPERWKEPLDGTTKSLPGPGLYTFISGPRNCIGQRFAQTELKVLLCHLISRLQFEVVPGWQLRQRQMIARRAFVIGQEAHGTRMPLIVTKLG